MEINWAQVKKITLWNYEELIQKILHVFSYDFVQEHYNHSMQEAESYANEKLSYLQNQREVEFINKIVSIYKTLNNLQFENYLYLIQKVETREKCEDFLKSTELPFNDLIITLQYIFRWILPFRFYLRELIDLDNETHTENLKILIQHKLKFNLDILEQCRTKEGRYKISKETGIAEIFILELTHRADISRLAYVRGKTVKHLCGGGYDTLDKLANADMEKMKADMESYYNKIGKKYSDFQNVIPLYWMVGGARTLPRIVEL